MRVFRLSVGLGCAVVGVVTIAASSPARARARELSRIRAHFDSVLTELAAADSPSLTAAQRNHRAEVLAAIGAYRDRGVFPHNYDFPGRLMPYFVDPRTGTLCAVANLLAVTGRRDIVDRVARADNNVVVSQLAGDTAFTHWLNDEGLTLAEAARIQVLYAQPLSGAEVGRTATFMLVAPAAVATSAVTSLMNAFGNDDGHRTKLEATGIVSGAVAIAAGALLLPKTELLPQAGSLAATSAAAGALSIVLSASRMHRHALIMASQQDSVRNRATTETSISPIVTTANGKPSAGVGVSVRF